MKDVRTWMRRRGFNLRIDEWVWKAGEQTIVFSQDAVARAETNDTARQLLVMAVNEELEGPRFVGLPRM